MAARPVVIDGVTEDALTRFVIRSDRLMDPDDSAVSIAHLPEEKKEVADFTASEAKRTEVWSDDSTTDGKSFSEKLTKATGFIPDPNDKSSLVTSRFRAANRPSRRVSLKVSELGSFCGVYQTIADASVLLTPDTAAGYRVRYLPAELKPTCEPPNTKLISEARDALTKSGVSPDVDLLALAMMQPIDLMVTLMTREITDIEPESNSLALCLIAGSSVTSWNMDPSSGTDHVIDGLKTPILYIPQRPDDTEAKNARAVVLDLSNDDVLLGYSFAMLGMDPSDPRWPSAVVAQWSSQRERCGQPPPWFNRHTDLDARVFLHANVYPILSELLTGSAVPRQVATGSNRAISTAVCHRLLEQTILYGSRQDLSKPWATREYEQPQHEELIQSLLNPPASHPERVVFVRGTKEWIDASSPPPSDVSAVSIVSGYQLIIYHVLAALFRYVAEKSTVSSAAATAEPDRLEKWCAYTDSFSQIIGIRSHEFEADVRNSIQRCITGLEPKEPVEFIHRTIIYTYLRHMDEHYGMYETPRQISDFAEYRKRLAAGLEYKEALTDLFDETRFLSRSLSAILQSRGGLPSNQSENQITMFYAHLLFLHYQMTPRTTERYPIANFSGDRQWLLDRIRDNNAGYYRFYAQSLKVEPLTHEGMGAAIVKFAKQYPSLRSRFRHIEQLTVLFATHKNEELIAKARADAEAYIKRPVATSVPVSFYDWYLVTFVMYIDSNPDDASLGVGYMQAIAALFPGGITALQRMVAGTFAGSQPAFFRAIGRPLSTIEWIRSGGGGSDDDDGEEEDDDDNDPDSESGTDEEERLDSFREHRLRPDATIWSARTRAEATELGFKELSERPFTASILFKETEALKTYVRYCHDKQFPVHGRRGISTGQPTAFAMKLATVNNLTAFCNFRDFFVVPLAMSSDRESISDLFRLAIRRFFVLTARAQCKCASDGQSLLELYGQWRGMNTQPLPADGELGRRWYSLLVRSWYRAIADEPVRTEPDSVSLKLSTHRSWHSFTDNANLSPARFPSFVTVILYTEPRQEHRIAMARPLDMMRRTTPQLMDTFEVESQSVIVKELYMRFLRFLASLPPLTDQEKKELEGGDAITVAKMALSKSIAERDPKIKRSIHVDKLVIQRILQGVHESSLRDLFPDGAFVHRFQTEMHDEKAIKKLRRQIMIGVAEPLTPSLAVDYIYRAIEENGATPQRTLAAALVYGADLFAWQRMWYTGSGHRMRDTLKVMRSLQKLGALLRDPVIFPTSADPDKVATRVLNYGLLAPVMGRLLMESFEYIADPLIPFFMYLQMKFHPDLDDESAVRYSPSDPASWYTLIREYKAPMIALVPETKEGVPEVPSYEILLRMTDPDTIGTFHDQEYEYMVASIALVLECTKRMCRKVFVGKDPLTRIDAEVILSTSNLLSWCFSKLAVGKVPDPRSITIDNYENLTGALRLEELRWTSSLPTIDEAPFEFKTLREYWVNKGSKYISESPDAVAVSLIGSDSTTTEAKMESTTTTATAAFVKLRDLIQNPRTTVLKLESEAAKVASSVPTANGGLWESSNTAPLLPDEGASVNKTLAERIARLT